MRILRNVTLLAAIVALAVALVPPADAACTSSKFVRSLAPTGVSFIHIDNWSTTGGYYYYGAPGYGVGGYGRPPVTGAFNGVWWVLGDGNVGALLGQDNGTYYAGQAGGWFYYYAYSSTFYYAGYINGDWATPGVDGCVATDNPSPANNCVCVLLQDIDYSGNPVYAMLQARTNANANADFLAAGSDGNGNNGKIVLKPMPKITILGTQRDAGTNDLDFSVTVANDGGAVYSSVEGGDASGCNCLQGWQVYSKAVGRGVAPPADRSKAGGGWNLMNLTGGAGQGVNNFGAAISVEELCGSANQDIFLAAGLAVDSNMNAAPYADFVSENSTRIECGPQIADPEPIRPRIRPDSPRQIRGTQRSR